MGISKFYLIGIAAVLAAGATAHFKSMHEISQRTERLEQQLLSISSERLARVPSEAEFSQVASQPTADVRALSRRLEGLEETLAQIVQATDYLMERGQLPLATNKAGDLYAKLAEPTTPDDERLRALRLLRRNKALNDQAVYSALAWLEIATNSRTKRAVLQQLDGLTNAALKQPLLNLALSEPSADLREEAVENLRSFLDDPAVENSLWERLRTETDGDVREEIEDALEDGPATPARISALQQRASNPELPLEERLLALRGLREADGDAPAVIAELAQRAQTTQDVAERARLFDAFDGLRDPQLKLPLVHGLQDPNPVVRQRAADALSVFNSDPAVSQWLRHIADTDTDPRVQREAFQALQSGGR
jgi:hypothetical protein